MVESALVLPQCAVVVTVVSLNAGPGGLSSKARSGEGVPWWSP